MILHLNHLLYLCGAKEQLHVFAHVMVTRAAHGKGTLTFVQKRGRETLCGTLQSFKLRAQRIHLVHPNEHKT